MSFLKKIIHSGKRHINPPNWYNLRSTIPVSAVFGLDRGTPIDRYYIEEFLETNKALIHGDVLEVSENHYSKKFGTNIESFEVLHYNNKNPLATIIGDLTKKQTLPVNKIDCFICTQTFHFIYNFKDAIQGAHHLLKKGGILLATLAGISQISRYDMDRWGDYWRFTILSAAKSFGEVFGEEQVTVNYFGNVLSTIAFLEGISAEELLPEELNYKDENYQMLITIVARK
jgi:Methyltransferase domain